MKICKNCGSTNESKATKCTTCAMPGMLVDQNLEKPKQVDAIKPIYPKCTNCGTNEVGSGSKCQKCNFPKKQLNHKNQYQTKAS